MASRLSLLLLVLSEPSDASTLLPSAGVGGLGRRTPSSSASTPAAFRRRSRGWNLDSLSVRGGALDVADSELSEDYDSDEDELSEGELSNLEVDSEEEEADEEDESEEEEEAAPSSSSSASGPPVKLVVNTSLNSPLVDQHLEFTASRKRTVLSLRQAVSKTMRGRPPLSCVSLKFQGRTLDDDETVDDILEDVDSDDEDEGSDDESDIGEDEDTIKLKLTADIVPPVDAKFGIELREKIMKMSTKEIMEAYCVNMAGMVYGQQLQAKEGELYESTSNADGELNDEEDEEEEEELHSASTSSENHSLNIRKKAAQIQKQFESTLPAETLKLMEEEHERVKGADDEGTDGAGVTYGLIPQGSGSAGARAGRKGRTLKGGATMNVRRALQRNLNVNWADTTRNSLLFLFFGYFGGRNSFSRTFLLLSSPLCFFVQTRPMKVAMKQLFYTIGEPPGILLSLLPAPQQAIMSLDYGGTMRGLYGEKVLEGEEWLEMERAEEDGGEIGDVEFDDDDDGDEYDQYDEDDEYDSEEDY